MVIKLLVLVVRIICADVRNNDVQILNEMALVESDPSVWPRKREQTPHVAGNRLPV